MIANINLESLCEGAFLQQPLGQLREENTATSPQTNVIPMKALDATPTTRSHA